MGAVTRYMQYLPLYDRDMSSIQSKENIIYIYIYIYMYLYII